MTQIGRYEILGELGRGAMGIVYRALDPSIGRTVAIKTIRFSELVDPAERARLKERLRREAQSAGALNHPNIVTIYDAAEEGDIAYVAMELVDGPTLSNLMSAAGALDPKLILDVLTQTAAGLDYAHKRGIVHRDIKPANIMLREGSTVKVTDFGVAKIESQQMTQGGAVIGTPNYMPPEQIQGQQVDGRADQYSLAVIAYELMTGEKPFAGDSIAELVYKIVHEDPVPPRRLNASLDWAMDTVLLRALSKNPADRYASCADFMRALNNAAKASRNWRPIAPGHSPDMPTVMTAKVAPVPAAAAAPPVPEQVPRPVRIARVLATIIVGAALVSAAMVGAWEYFFSPDESAPPQVQDLTKTQRLPEPAPYVILPGESSQNAVDPPQTADNAKLENPVPDPVPPPNPTPPEQVKEERSREKPEPPPAETSVRFVTSPPGADLMVDGRGDQICKTPCELTLKGGRHTLAASAGGYRRALRIFEAPSDSAIVINLEKSTGTLAIRSEPPGASITIDGKMRPEKTPAALSLPTGRHRVEISKEGFTPYVEEIETKDAVISSMFVDLAGKGASR